MNSDLNSLVMAMQASRTQQLIQIAVARKAQQAETAIVNMIDEVISKSPAPLPAGIGQVVDKQA